MIFYLILVVIIILCTEICRYFNLTYLIKYILQINKKIFKLFFFNKSLLEIRKEKEAIKLSKKLLLASLKLFLIVALMFFIIISAGIFDNLNNCFSKHPVS